MKRIQQPQPRDTETIQKIFNNTGLSWGAAYVFKYKGQTYTIDDHKHCPETSENNIKALSNLMDGEGLCFIGKAYDADLYKATGRVTDQDFDNFKHSVDSWGEELKIMQEAVK